MPEKYKRHIESPGNFPPLLFLLSVAVILPTLCILWLMNTAVKNERMAVRQKLAGKLFPKDLLDNIQKALDEYRAQN